MQKYLVKIILLLLVINIIYVFCGVIFSSLQSMDSIAIWFLKAKAIYFGAPYFSEVIFSEKFNYSHQQYPLLLPLIIAIFYKATGGINANLALLLYPLTYSLIIILVYKTLRLKTSKVTALLFTYFYSMISPLIAGGGRILAGNADIFLVLILWVIIYLLYSKRNYYTYFILILVMIASQIKSEGIFLSVIILFLPIRFQNKLFFFLISISPFLLWQGVIHVLNIPSDQAYVFHFGKIFIVDMFLILRESLKEIININNWYIYSLIILILIFTKEKTSKELKKILKPSFVIMLSLYVIVYLTINTDTYKEVSSSFDRVLLQLSPIIFMYFFEKINQIFIRYRILK